MKTISLRVGAALGVAILGLCMAGAAMADVTGSAGWSRATPPGAKEAVGYLVLTNQGEEERSLLKITSPVSDRVTIHRSTIDSQGVAQMWVVGKVQLEPGETLQFDPNGLHVMFADIKAAFKAGDKVPLTLQFDGFEKAFTVMLEVRPLVPAAPAADHGAHKH